MERRHAFESTEISTIFSSSSTGSRGWSDGGPGAVKCPGTDGDMMEGNERDFEYKWSWLRSAWPSRMDNKLVAMSTVGVAITESC